MRRLVVGFTGASGIRYGLRLLGETGLLKKRYREIYVVYTEPARMVAKQEEGIDLQEYLSKNTTVDGIYGPNKWGSPLASSSRLLNTDMVIVPASMDTVAKLAGGIQDNLLLRTASAVMRLKGRLIVVFREAPLSTIDLWNLYKLSMSGAIIMPAAPGFYTRPENIEDMLDFIVGKILDTLGIENNLYRRWLAGSSENII